jgi:diguanylate cyclase (GGDEF)-like protein
MATERKIIEKLKISESESYSKLTSYIDTNNNKIMPELQKLHECCIALLKHAEQLINKKDQAETKLVELNRSLNLATRVDPMTGLANRRAIMEMIKQEFSRSNRHQRNSSIIIANLDNFKNINETLGYNTGDDLLVEVSRVLRGCLRNEDICARWGGEEFLILLPETRLDGALAVAEKIRESIAMTVFLANREGIRITTSLGVCEHKSDQDIFEAISRADQALRQAKSGGKNRALVAP